MATTLLPCTSSLSTISQRDALLIYCIISQHKVNLSLFIVNHFIEASIDPSSLSYGLIITRILEANNIPFEVVLSNVVKKCYNTKAFGSM